MPSALSALDDAPVWLNSQPLTAEGLRGRVVLLDIWTYSCVNWLRTLPYVRAWAETYRDRGLVVVGVHAPEFGFEHELDNVHRAVAELGVGYPVVLDNDFAIWRSLDNHYWPAVYLVDGDGRVGFQHFGEEAYEETERAIQQLLGVDGDTVRVDAGGLAQAADWNALRSPETYLGYLRAERRTDAPPTELALNRWALTGEWSVGEEAAVLASATGSIAYRFQARDVNMVLAGGTARFVVRVDGRPPGDDHGLDVDEAGSGTISQPRMYQLVRRRGDTAERTFEITFLDPGARAYVFTFG
jgi:thiol-disulfide isomerase/thioredoxin